MLPSQGSYGRGSFDGELILSQPRSGRPPIPSSVRRKVIKHTQGKRRRSTRKTAERMRAKGYKISRKSVRRILRSAGLKPYRRRKQPRLTAKHKKKRVAFAKKYLDHDWMETLITDEKDFLLYPRPNPQNERIWAEDASKVPPVELMKHSPGLKVWGGVSACGKTELQFYKGTINTQGYLDILEEMLPQAEEIFGDEDWCFQHDGASAHKAKRTNDWLQEQVPQFIASGPSGEWPANSPDLSFIENCWAIMEADIGKNPPKSLIGLKRKIKQAWNNLKPEVLTKMAQGMRGRLQDVIDKKGECIGK
jgi:hypothetical protein